MVCRYSTVFSVYYTRYDMLKSTEWGEKNNSKTLILAFRDNRAATTHYLLQAHFFPLLAYSVLGIFSCSQKMRSICILLLFRHFWVYEWILSEFLRNILLFFCDFIIVAIFSSWLDFLGDFKTTAKKDKRLISSVLQIIAKMKPAQRGRRGHQDHLTSLESVEKYYRLNLPICICPKETWNTWWWWCYIML